MARFLSDAQLKFKENLYLHYITGGIYITQKLPVEDFLLYFAFDSLFQVSSSNRPSH
jgi:hypothetical protein